MEIKIFATICAIIALSTLSTINSEQDKMEEIGAEIAEKIKPAGLELFDTNINAAQELGEKLSMDAEATPEIKAGLKRFNGDLEKFREEVHKMKASELINAINDFIREKRFRMLRNTDGSYKANKYYSTEAIKTIEDYDKALEEAVQKFAMLVYNEWTEIFKTIPKDELEKHREYELINEQMEDVKKTNGDSAVFWEAFKGLREFFQYKGWTYFLI